MNCTFVLYILFNNSHPLKHFSQPLAIIIAGCASYHLNPGFKTAGAVCPLMFNS